MLLFKPISWPRQTLTGSSPYAHCLNVEVHIWNKICELSQYKARSISVWPKYYIQFLNLIFLLCVGISCSSLGSCIVPLVAFPACASWKDRRQSSLLLINILDRNRKQCIWGVSEVLELDPETRLLNKLLLRWFIFRWQSSYDLTCFFFLDVRQGLIGVGLINVEDRSGILTLDKGICVFSVSLECC